MDNAIKEFLVGLVDSQEATLNRIALETAENDEFKVVIEFKVKKSDAFEEMLFGRGNE